MSQKYKKQVTAKRDDVINPPNYNFSHFNTDNFDALKTLRTKSKIII